MSGYLENSHGAILDYKNSLIKYERVLGQRPFLQGSESHLSQISIFIQQTLSWRSVDKRPWITGSGRSLHTTVSSRRQDSRPITRPGFTAFWLESIKCWSGKALGQSPLAEFGRGSLSNARQYTHRERLPACWLLFADCCMCSTRNISQTDNREKNGPDGDLQFFLFLFFFFSLPCGRTRTTMLSVR